MQHTLMTLQLFLNCHHCNSPHIYISPYDQFVEMDQWECTFNILHCNMDCSPITTPSRVYGAPFPSLLPVTLLNSCKIILNECSGNRPPSLEAKPHCPVIMSRATKSLSCVDTAVRWRGGYLRRQSHSTQASASAPLADGGPTLCPRRQGRKRAKSGAENETSDPEDTMARSRSWSTAFQGRRCGLIK